MKKQLVVILNDGETWSSIEDCNIAVAEIDEAINEISKIHEYINLGQERMGLHPVLRTAGRGNMLITIS